MKMLQAGAVIGLLGGGQLAGMLAAAAARLGFKTVVFAPEQGCCAEKAACEHIVASYHDQAALDRLAGLCDVITYEFENIPVATVEYLASRTVVQPRLAALEIAQDRFLEKKFLNECNIATAAWRLVEDQETLIAALAACGGKGILKTRRFGYDGKGQAYITQQGEQAALDAIGHVPAILEGVVRFTREVSVIAARGQDGKISFFDIPENVHREGILRSCAVPAGISPQVAGAVQDATAVIAHALDYVGVVAVEFFVTDEGTVLANEFSPRVHNSGHWTEAACVISQFEQHIRAIAGLPLGAPVRHSDCVMENLIGDDVQKVPELLQQPGTFIHLYGKGEGRPGRKMGHVVHLKGK